MTSVTISWSTFKSALAYLRAYYVANSDGSYFAYAVSQSMIFACAITAGADITDFENNYKSAATSATSQDEAIAQAVIRSGFTSVQGGEFNDPRVVHRLGNLTASSTNEVLVCARGYVEQGAQAQRSVVSTSASDKSGGGGAVAVRIKYLDSNYVLKTEDVALNGTVAVNTVNSDIRFIEDFFVIQGADAVGAVKLMTTTGGAGSEFAGIGAGTSSAFLCHHYVPAGKTAYVIGYGWSNDVQLCSYKLKGQQIVSNNRTDTILDLQRAVVVTGGENRSYVYLTGIQLQAKTYVRVTVAPNANTSTVIRSTLDLWEDNTQ